MNAAAPSRSDPQHARNVWMATVRPDGRPHQVPVWFVVSSRRWYICIEPDSVKARNIAASPRVALALEDGNDPYIMQGRTRPTVIQFPPTCPPKKTHSPTPACVTFS